MQETLKYIKVLNWGYGGFAPMTLTPDYKESLEQVRERLGLLDSLNYLSLLDEATSTKGKAWLDKYSNTGGIEYNLHFMRDRMRLLDMLQSNVCKRDGDKLKYSENPNRMFGWAFEGIEKYLADKSWSKKQYNEYKLALRELEKALEDRLRQFAAAYDYPLSADDPEQQPEPQQEQKKTTRGRGRPKETLRDKVAGNDPEFIDKLHTLIDGKKGKDFALYIRACVDLGKITKPTYKQVAEEFGDIGHKSGYNKYMNGQLYSYEEIKGAENQILSL